MKSTVYIDGTLLVRGNMSGIGRVAHHTIDSLIKNKEFTKRYDLVVFAASGSGKQLAEKYESYQQVKVKELLLPHKVLELLSRMRALPPIDLFLGKGIYVFFNFRNFPLYESKSITYIHDLSFIDVPQFSQSKNGKYLKRHIRSWILRADKIITISRFSQDRLRVIFNVPDDKLVVIYCGYDPAALNAKVDIKNVKSILRKYNLPNEYIISVGNIEPRKNFERLVNAYGRLDRKIADQAPLVIVGADGWNNESIENTIRNVRARGYRVKTPASRVTDEDLAVIMEHAKGLVAPSLYEGFSLPPLEAYVQKTPVAISDITVHRELYDKSAIFFNPYDVQGITGALNRLINGQGIKPRFDDKLLDLTWDLAASKLYNVIDSLQEKH